MMFIKSLNEISLRERKQEHVKKYFYKTRDEEIQNMIPCSAKSVEDALAMYEETLLKDATSYGKTIYYKGQYIGDVWCYGLDILDEPNAMLSYCIFEKDYWNNGIATTAVAMFVEELIQRFRVKSIGAFLYANNASSKRVLEKNGFIFRDELIEDGRSSLYYEKYLDKNGVGHN